MPLVVMQEDFLVSDKFTHLAQFYTLGPAYNEQFDS